MWQLDKEPESGHLRIRHTYTVKNFKKSIELMERIAQVAEQEGHHPDLHLEVSHCPSRCSCSRWLALVTSLSKLPER